MERPRRGHVQITDRGRDLLRAGGPIRNSTLEQFAEYQEFQAKSRQRSQEKQPTAPAPATPDPDESPSDLIARAEATPPRRKRPRPKPRKKPGSPFTILN